MAALQLASGPKECSHEPAQAGAIQARFSPYDYNGGTVLAIAGKDFAVVAGDTRMSTGFNIMSRHVSKIFEICPGTTLATGGFRGDITTLQKLLRAKVTTYAHQHREGMKPHAVAQMLANTLYGRRFFPYYTWNVVAGLDEDGVGVVYSYDPVGNYERVRVSVTGSGESLIQPLLDNQLERQHQASGAKPPPLSCDLSLEETLELVKDAFVSASERDIRTGDCVEICIITKDGSRMESMPLNID
jgi:20S proteasome subunit beta 6